LKKKVVSTASTMSNEAKGIKVKKGRRNAKEEDDIILCIDKALKQGNELSTKIRP
jgi:hypothetical protein